MEIKIVNEIKPELIHPKDMLDGTIGVLNYPGYTNVIVVKKYDILVALDSGSSYWSKLDTLPGNFMIRLLPKNTKIEITV